MSSFLTQLKSGRPLLLDGATGTELNRRGLNTDLPLWSARAVIERLPEELRGTFTPAIVQKAIKKDSHYPDRGEPFRVEEVGEGGAGEHFVDAVLRFGEHGAQRAIAHAGRGHHAFGVVGYAFLQGEHAFDALENL